MGDEDKENSVGESLAEKDTGSVATEQAEEEFPRHPKRFTTAFIMKTHNWAPETSPIARVRQWLQEEREVDKRSAQAAIQKSKMFILLSDTSSDPHFIKDLSLRYVYVNQAMERLLKRTRKDIIGLTDEDLFAPEEVEALKSACRLAAEGSTVREEKVLTIGGVRRRFLDTVSPWKDDSGHITALYGTYVDVTDRREIVLGAKLLGGDSGSASMREAFTQALLVAKVDTTVLLTGESGCGKDFMARFIHDHSNRAGSIYKSVNCAALPENLVESELFGHEKGAFSGADRAKKGLVEQAHGGTLLLNEIGELPLALQAKLLTFLDTSSFTRLGGERESKVDVRILAATNRNLERAIEADVFRSDLYYRLNVFSIRIPPLRERKEDIPRLSQTLVREISKRLNLETSPKIMSSFVKALVAYNWPGNVRELRNVLEKALVLTAAKGVPLDANCLDLPASSGQTSGSHGGGIPPNAEVSHGGSDKAVNHPGHGVFGMEMPKRPIKPNTEDLQSLFEDYVENRGWTRARLARELGVDSSTLKKWFKAAGLPAGDRGRPRKSGASEVDEPE